MKTTAVVVLALWPAAASAQGGAVTYYFGSSDERTNITFESKTAVATISGTTAKVSGSASRNDAAGERKTHLIVPVASMRTGMEGRDKILLEPNWLDAAKYPTLEFKSEKAEPAGGTTWKLQGEFTMHGKTNPLTITADVKEISPAVAAKAKLGPGAWVRVVTEFKLKLSDYGIAVPEANIAQVNDEWTVTVAILGTTEKPAGGAAVGPGPETGPTVEVPKAKLPDGVPGKRHAFGLKQNMTTVRVVSESDAGRVTVSSTVIGGQVAIDTAGGAIALSLPVASLSSGAAERDKALRGAEVLGATEQILFESTKAALDKDGKTWSVEGILTLRGQKKPVKMTAEMRQLTNKQMWEVRWSRKPGVGFAGQFAVKLSDFGIKPEGLAAAGLSDEVTVHFDLVAAQE